MNRILVLRPDELTDVHLTRWRQIHESAARFASPYFTPEFTQAVGSVRRDVEVAVLEESGEVVGFFPFQRGLLGFAKPVGGQLSDFHGVIVRNGVSWSPQRLLSDARLRTWSFNHLIASQREFAPYCSRIADSPYIDLSNGFDDYRIARERDRSSQFVEAVRKLRRVERDLGPVRFVAHTTDEGVFQSLLRWKSAQYRRSGFHDVFAHTWTIQLLRRVLTHQDTNFAGMLAALYVGDRLAAVQLGMRSNAVVHLWFPAYDTVFSKYSVGLILLLELARVAERLGIRRIDLGRGNERYKRDFMSATTAVAEGAVDRSWSTSLARSGHRRVRSALKASPMPGIVERVLHILRPARAWYEFR